MHTRKTRSTPIFAAIALTFVVIMLGTTLPTPLYPSISNKLGFSQVMITAIFAVYFGTPTRFGNMSGQMRTFLDQTGGLWANGKLVNKLGSVFTSSATGGGNETTITSFWNTLVHHGMLIVPVDYAGAPELFDISELRGGSPYRASTYAGGDGTTTNWSHPRVKWTGRGNVSSRRERIEQAKSVWKAQNFPKVIGDDEEFIPLPE